MNKNHKNLSTDFSKCGCCNRELSDEEIDIAGIDNEGFPRAVGHCCLDQLTKVLSVGIPTETPDPIFKSVVRNLEPRGIDVDSIKLIHSANVLPYALHIFTKSFQN